MGVPLGLLVGHRIWSSIAGNAHVVVRTVLPVWWIALVAGAVVAGAGLVALLPVLRTRRVRPAEVLRTE